MDQMDANLADALARFESAQATWATTRELPLFRSILAGAAVVSNGGLPALRDTLSGEDYNAFVLLVCQAIGMYQHIDQATTALGNLLVTVALARAIENGVAHPAGLDPLPH